MRDVPSSIEQPEYSKTGVLPVFRSCTRIHAVFEQGCRFLRTRSLLHTKFTSTALRKSRYEHKNHVNVLIVLLLQGIREACRIGREVLDIAARHVRVGVTTEEIDRVVHEATIARNAYPSPLNYKFFPKSCCTYVVVLLLISFSHCLCLIFCVQLCE